MICDNCKKETKPYGKKTICYRCYMKDFNKRYYQKNKEKIKKQTNEFYHKNKEKHKETMLAYSLRNKEALKEKAKKYYLDHKDMMLNRMKDNYEKNKIRYNKTAYQNKKKRLLTDVEFKLKETLSTRMRMAIINHKGIKKTSSIELLGAPIEVVRRHIENQFQEGMSWSNHGIIGWHIDHIKPCDAFDLSDPVQQKKCFHYTNLQPLWYIDNIRKDNTYKEESYPS